MLPPLLPSLFQQWAETTITYGPLAFCLANAGLAEPPAEVNLSDHLQTKE